MFSFSMSCKEDYAESDLLVHEQLTENISIIGLAGSKRKDLTM